MSNKEKELKFWDVIIPTKALKDFSSDLDSGDLSLDGCSILKSKFSFDKDKSFYEGAITMLFIMITSKLSLNERFHDDFGSTLLNELNLQSKLFNIILEHVLKNREGEKDG